LAYPEIHHQFPASEKEDRINEVLIDGQPIQTLKVNQALSDQ